MSNTFLMSNKAQVFYCTGPWDEYLSLKIGLRDCLGELKLEYLPDKDYHNAQKLELLA